MRLGRCFRKTSSRYDDLKRLGQDPEVRRHVPDGFAACDVLTATEAFLPGDLARLIPGR